MKKSIIIFTLITHVLLLNIKVHTQTIDNDFWSTNNHVYSICPSENIIYVGGDFTFVGPKTGHGAAIDIINAQPDLSLPEVNGIIYSVVSDGEGGWYICGNFSKVGNVLRNYIAHIKSDGTLDLSWNPDANYYVYCMALSGSTIYVGGQFTHIGGQARSRIAALDAVSGNATSWNPNANGNVNTIAISGGTIYVGGEFTTIGGQSRNRIAALDISTGNVTSWNPNSSNTVYSLYINNSIIYAGGNFTNIGGQSRNYIAALDSVSGNATSWDPDANNSVFTIFVSDTIVYVGGNFTSIGEGTRNRIAALGVSTGSATGWNPNSNNSVNAITVSGSTLYAGGNFTSIGGEPRNFFAALDINTGEATSFVADADNKVLALSIFGSKIYVGGEFNYICGKVRNYIAAFDVTTGKATNWNPNANGSVRIIYVHGNTVYLGGLFTSVGEQVRNRIAAVEKATGNVTSWDPNANNRIEGIAVKGSTIYVSGYFTQIGGQNRNYIAAIDSATGTITGWNPNAGYWVRRIYISGSTLYACGSFTTMGGQQRRYIAALDTETGNVTSWDPNASDGVADLAISNSIVYASGAFTTIGGKARNRIAALDITTGNATDWNPGANVAPITLAILGSSLYAGGYFTNMDGQTRNRLAAVDLTSGHVTSWNPDANDRVEAVAVLGSDVYVGGLFTDISNSDHTFLARVNGYVRSDTSLVAYYPFNGNANDESGNGNNGIIYGPVLVDDRFGIANRAFNFDGIDDSIMIPASSNLTLSDSFTISLWIKTNASGRFQNIINKRKQFTNDLELRINELSNGVDFNKHGYATLMSSSPVKTNTWTFICVSYDGTLAKIYLNSVLDKDSSGVYPFGTSLSSIVIGNAWDGSTPFSGYIDDIRIYNRALTESEIDSLYHEGGYPITNSISGVKFNDLNANGVKDISDTCLAGWKIFLSNSMEEIVDSTLTDSTGYYVFKNIPSGAYKISESQQSNWIQTYPGGLGVYHAPVDANSQIVGLDFGNTYGYSYIGPVDGNWSDSANWTGGKPPDSSTAAVIPTDASVIVDSLPSKSVVALSIEKNAKLKFQPQVGQLDIKQTFQIQEGGEIEFSEESDTTGLVCRKDFLNRGTFIPGHSIITLAGDKPKVIASEGTNNTFYRLNIAGDSTSTIGNVIIENQLILSREISPREQDSIIIENNDTSAISDTGRITQGTIKRSIKPNETGTYRFESPESYIKFTGEGTNPNTVSITTIPNRIPVNLLWDSLGGYIDTVKNIIVVDTTSSFSKWVFGIPRPRIATGGINLFETDPINRTYKINAEGGVNYKAQVSLRYEQSEVPESITESELKLLRGPYLADSLMGGWNMISLPLIPKTNLKTELFPTATTNAFAFDEKYVARSNLSFGEGYWLKFPVAQLHIISGEDRMSNIIPVKEGWNLVGTISYPIKTSSIKSNPDGIIRSTFFGYNGSYIIVDSLKPLSGYWVKVDQNGELILSKSEENILTMGKSETDILKQFNTLTFCDALGKEFIMYFGKDDQIELDRYELPPKPPEGIFDVRYASGRMLEVVGKETKDYPIQISSAEYPITIRWELKEATQYASLIIDGQVINLNKNGATEIRNPESEIKLRLTSLLSTEVPKKFALYQNYPNPFNPTTTIKYQIPVASKVTLKIYNLLGQEVQTLVDEHQEAGYKSVEWQVDNISSGVYFYRLTAESSGKSFVAIKKLLLMK